MALTSAEKLSVVTLLGWPGKVLDSNSTHYNTTIAGRVENLSAELEASTKSALEKISVVDGKIEAAQGRLAASQVDSIKTNPEELNQLRKERRIRIRELGELLDIPYLKSGSGMVSVCV